VAGVGEAVVEVAAAGVGVVAEEEAAEAAVEARL
jgi:hypothetical protein